MLACVYPPSFPSSSVPPKPHESLPKTLCFHAPSSMSFGIREFGRVNFDKVVVLRCISSSVHTVGWNEPISCSEVGYASNCNSEEEFGDSNASNVEEDALPSIPVRAYIFSTSVDLKSLVERNKSNHIPPTSRMTNYVVFKFGSLSNSSSLGACLSGSDCCYMIVFQYGSIVLFNVQESEVENYLKIVREHASSLLPEMRKDGKVVS